MSATPRSREEDSSHDQSSSSPPWFHHETWRANLVKIVSSELTKQRGIVVPLIAMNLSWFAKLAITTAFLGRLGELQLAGGALGLTFANVTGFSVLNGLSGAMEPICGQAYGAKNFKLLHKTLLMTTILLLMVTLPISFLWLNVDKILIHFGQRDDMIIIAKRYLLYLIPDLPVTSLLCPLKAYLSSQGITMPTMLSYALGVVFHVPINILLSKIRGLEGVSMAVWITDLMVVILLVIYVLITETNKGFKWNEGGWLDQGINDWITLLRLSGPCCLTTCLEWWCYEILILVAGRLANAKQAVAVLAVVLNFDYLLYSVMLSLATCASTRVSNELGANQASRAYQAAQVSVATGFISGCLGAVIMVAVKGLWGVLFSHDKVMIREVKKMMMVMALVEVVNFPLVVCGGIVRGTARPSLATYANLGGFYFLALPMGVALAFKGRLGLGGLLIGFLAGSTLCLILLLVFIVRINWLQEAGKAQVLVHEDANK
ncbi:Protein DETOXIFICATION 56 [Dionaea muscipula]